MRQWKQLENLLVFVDIIVWGNVCIHFFINVGLVLFFLFFNQLWLVFLCHSLVCFVQGSAGLYFIYMYENK